MPHTIKEGDFCVNHKANINMASRTVIADGIGVARRGDSTDRGAMIGASDDVLAG